MDNTGIMLPLGLVLRDRYRIEEYLASGGFGNTYRVHDMQLDEDFALKEFFCRTINSRNRSTQYVTVSNPGNMADFQSLHKKFRKEALRIRGLSGDHIVKVYDLFEEFGTSYYVMDFIDGESLQTMVKRRGPLPEAEVLGYLEQMLDGLEEIHRESIWHLDIKPGNMMLDKKGRLRLIDFGASKLVDLSSGAMTSSMAMAYTPGYAPIEQTEQKLEAIGAHTDLYAIGATLYNLLTNERPPSTVDLISMGDSAFNYPPTVSQPMRDLIAWLMQVRGENRPQNVAQVRHFLASHDFTPAAAAEPPKTPADDETVASTTATEPSEVSEPTDVSVPSPQPSTVMTEPEPLPSEQSKSSKKGLYIGGAIAAVLIALIIVFFHNSESHPKLVKVAGAQTFTANGVSFTMIPVEGGTFTMGATEEQGSDADDDEMPAHQVTLSGFSIGQTEVTQELWQAVMGSNPSYCNDTGNSSTGSSHSKNFGTNLQRPVEEGSWDDCQVFITKLNQITGQNFRLPTEAEWEYAARGGNKSHGYKYAGSNTLGEVAWQNIYIFNYMTIEVAKKAANELGLYDMSGSVSEWCQDWYGSYSSDAQTNPTGPDSGSERVCRSGVWSSDARYCRVSRRRSMTPSLGVNDIGLRLAL